MDPVHLTDNIHRIKRRYHHCIQTYPIDWLFQCADRKIFVSDHSENCGGDRRRCRRRIVDRR